MTGAGSSPHAAPSVCPFVALAEDRDRRADGPDERNRCYAERAPRRRDLAYQAEFCYSAGFASCSAFLGWAARNAAEPAYITDAARTAWASGIAAPEGHAAGHDDDGTHAWDAAGTPSTGVASDYAWPGDGGAAPTSTPEGGLFGPPSIDDARTAAPPQELDWVSASAWEAAPWDPDAEAEAEEMEAFALEEPIEVAEEEPPVLADEALQGPKVPAALPMRRRQRLQSPIRARGSGEWLYADPLEHESLVRRRGGIGAPILLAVLGLLVVSIVVFLLPALLAGGTPAPAAVASATPGASQRAQPTRAPQRTSEPSASPSVAPEPEVRVYTVKPGNTLSAIAARFDVSMRQLQCLNIITNVNLLQPGQKLLIPPEGFSCPPGWRDMTPPPIP